MARVTGNTRAPAMAWAWAAAPPSNVGRLTAAAAARELRFMEHGPGRSDWGGRAQGVAAGKSGQARRGGPVG